jgi:hypothetical protein
MEETKTATLILETRITLRQLKAKKPNTPMLKQPQARPTPQAMELPYQAVVNTLLVMVRKMNNICLGVTP